MYNIYELCIKTKKNIYKQEKQIKYNIKSPTHAHEKVTK